MSTPEKVLVFYLVVAVWWNTHKWMTSGKVIRQLTKERDKYKEAWTNGNDVIIWEKHEEVRSRK